MSAQANYLNFYSGDFGRYTDITITTEEAPPMQFTIARTDLVAAIRLARIAILSKTNLPILTHLLLDASPTRGLTITATDLVSIITATVPANVTAGGQATVPASLAAAMLAQCGDPTLTVALDKGGKVRISGGGTKLALPTLVPSDFPVSVGDQEIVPFAACPVEMFGVAIERVAFAAAAEHGNSALTGIHLECEGAEVRLTTTDGYRLATTTLPVERPSAAERVARVVPAAALAELARALPGGTLTLGLAHNTITFAVAGAVTARIRTIDGAFPSFRQVMPTVFAMTARLNRSALQNAAKLAELAAGQVKGKGAGFTRLDLTMSTTGLTVRGADTAEAEIAVPLIVGPLDSFLTRLDAGFLVQALGAIAGETVELRGNTKETVFILAPTNEGDATLHCIQPMHINEAAATTAPTADEEAA